MPGWLTRLNLKFLVPTWHSAFPVVCVCAHRSLLSKSQLLNFAFAALVSLKEILVEQHLQFCSRYMESLMAAEQWDWSSRCSAHLCEGQNRKQVNYVWKGACTPKQNKLFGISKAFDTFSETDSSLMLSVTSCNHQKRFCKDYWYKFVCMGSRHIITSPSGYFIAVKAIVLLILFISNNYKILKNEEGQVWY